MLSRLRIFHRLSVLLIVGATATAFSAAAAAAPTTAPATAPATTIPADFEQRLGGIDARAAGWKDLTADFVQEKQSPLLRKPLVSRGTVKAKGSASLWQTVEPEPSVLSVDPRLLRLYYPKQKVVEEYTVEAKLGMLAASPLPSLTTVRRNFKLLPDDGVDLRPGGNEGRGHALFAVRMKPADDEIARFVRHVRVLLDVDRGLVLVFEMVDPDGERTLIRFSNLRGNAGLRDEDLSLVAPPGTKVVRPLEGATPRHP